MPKILRFGIPALCGVIFFLWSGAGQAVQCGPDEGMEFAKALLVARDPSDIPKTWNDQPWFISQVYAVLVAAPWGARLLTLLLCAVLSGSLPRLMPSGCRWPHIVFGWLFLWAWPNFNHLCVSAMIDLPAYSVAVIGAAVLPRKPQEWTGLRFGVGGALFALAAHIKLTSLLVAPAAASWVVCNSLRWYGDALFPCAQKKSLPAFRLWIPPMIGVATVVSVFALLVMVSPVWNLSYLWGSHEAAARSQEAAKLKFHPEELLLCPGVITAAALAVVALWRQRRLLDAVFAFVLFCTLLLVHLHHRPWWYYYGVQFAVPLAILGGWQVGEMLSFASQNRARAPESLRSAFSRESALLLGTLPLAVWVAFDSQRTFDEVRFTCPFAKISESNVIAVLKQYRREVKWAYCRENIWLFHAGYLLPPELTNLCKKRFWTGNMNEKGVLETVERYHCELLVLNPGTELKQGIWKRFVQKGYVRVWSDEANAVFVAKRLNPKPEPTNLEYLKYLGADRNIGR